MARRAQPAKRKKAAPKKSTRKKSAPKKKSGGIGRLMLGGAFVAGTLSAIIAVGSMLELDRASDEFGRAVDQKARIIPWLNRPRRPNCARTTSFRKTHRHAVGQAILLATRKRQKVLHLKRRQYQNHVATNRNQISCPVTVDQITVLRQTVTGMRRGANMPPLPRMPEMRR